MRASLGWIITLLPLVAAAQEPPPRQLLVEPVLGANAFTFAWNRGAPYLGSTALQPGLRVGLQLPKLAVDGRLGFFTSGNPFDGYSGLSGLSLDAEAMPQLGMRGDNTLYGLAGLGFGTLFEISPSDSQFVPHVNLTVGGGLEHPINTSFSVGLEGGARTQLTFYSGGYTQVTTGLFIAFTGKWLMPWPGTRAREQAPGNVPAGPAGPVTVAKDGNGPPPVTPQGDGTPPAYGYSTTPCYAYVTDGWFSPTQGVWEDDPIFEDRPRKQLTRLPGDEVVYDAELPMVQGRDTLLFGVHHYRKEGQQVIVDSRDVIVLKGMTNCTVPQPVKLKFAKRNVVEGKLIYMSEVVGQVPLTGAPAKTFSPWEVRLPVRDGVPTDKPFQFDVNMDHRLVAELVRENGAPTGLQMTVNVYAVPTQGPVVHFVPVMLSPTPADREGGLLLLTQVLADESAKKIPDLFPLVKGGLPTQVKVIRNFIDKDIGSKYLEFRRIDALVAALNDTLAASTFLDGAGRVVAVMKQDDFKSIFTSQPAVGMTVSTSVTATPKDPQLRARTLSWKVMMVPATESWDTVGHELVHSLPEGWASSGMKKECGRDYHNVNEPIANGERINEAGEPKRERKAGMAPLMGPAVPSSEMWITQCTYAHLLREMAGVTPDPPVLLVRAMLSKEGGKMKGELRPLYQMMGQSDVAAGKGGPWAVVLRDAKGAELGRYPLSPSWNDIETGTPRSVVSMVLRVPALPGAAVVELQGPGGVQDSRRLDAEPPRLRILTPGERDRLVPAEGKVRITWEASAAENRPLLYSVLYSSDGGAHFATQIFEMQDTAFDVAIDPKAKDHRVKVIATDGARSSEVVIPLVLQEPGGKPGK